MTTTSETISQDRLLDDLDRFAQVRQSIARTIDDIVYNLRDAETQGEALSGKLGLEREIDDLNRSSINLKDGVFRLMVLGDMKRGKSTFLNALIGENLLPSDVNPCTALLTILRYGKDKKVTVYFNDGKPPEQLEFAEFKTRYTIDPAEAKSLEQNNQQAFPTVSHAVVEYPLALLERGVEIVDSPGLNDTEARNELSLGYLGQCHAVLFVLRATQPCTLAERRYLENYIKDRGLSVFFLINAWDQIKESLIDPDDATELAEAKTKLDKVFRVNLEDYCVVDGIDVYEERVFPISAIQALRKRVKDVNADLSGTGFSEFLAALNVFLTQERAIAQLRQARTLTKQTLQRSEDAIKQRIPLLEQNVVELRDRIASVEPEFAQLNGIRNDFRDEIRLMRDQKSREVADSFRDYVFKLENTFEEDFLRYQPPNLGFLQFLSGGQRELFAAQFQQAFQQYVNDKFCAWSLTAERKVDDAFKQLADRASSYGASYFEVTEKISQKLTGQKIRMRVGTIGDDENAPGWAKWAMGLFSALTGNFAGAAMAFGGFDAGSILLNFFTTAGIALVATSIFGLILGPITLALIGLGVGVLQTDHARRELAKATKRELLKHLPQFAQEQWQPVYSAVQDSFDRYEKEIADRIDDDIQSRQAELDNLLKQKESRELDRDAETFRLRSLQAKLQSRGRSVEKTYQDWLGQQR
jgi:GTPase SAR1 family protein